MDQDTLYELADNLADYIVNYAKGHGLEATIETCCCGTLELRYRDPESGGYYSAEVDVDPPTGDVE